MFRRKWLFFGIAVLCVVAILYALILQPSVQEWVGNHFLEVYTGLKTWLNPPQAVAFSTLSTPQASLSTLPAEDHPTTPTPLTTPIPSSVEIGGGKYFDQHNRMNYCGPANLAMLLSYQGWNGTPEDIARVVKPYAKDKNVMPAELADYARSVGFGALVRVGGDLGLLKRIIAAGYPVLVEKGPHFRDIQNNITWMGHYQVLNGYDDARGVFIAQDSYIKPNYDQSYNELISQWRSFNYTYLVVFPQSKENDVLNLLGADAEESANFQHALKIAGEETSSLRGVDQFFAFFNYGTNLVALRDYAGAAAAYDTAFALYDALPQDMTLRPYRILWYQTGPYFAYYYTGRYQDVINKATLNSIDMVRDDVPALEESYYWRGMAYIAIGDQQDGIDDLQTCLMYHKGFTPCVQELNLLGIAP